MQGITKATMELRDDEVFTGFTASSAAAKGVLEIFILGGLSARLSVYSFTSLLSPLLPSLSVGVRGVTPEKTCNLKCLMCIFVRWPIPATVKFFFYLVITRQLTRYYELTIS